MIDINKKYRTKDGCEVELWKISEDERDDKHPVLGRIIEERFIFWHAWNQHGKSNINANRDLVEVSPYDNFNIDDKVVVWDNDNKLAKYHRHFAGLSKSGKPQVFSVGNTSWSGHEEVVESWDNCVKSQNYEDA